MDRQNRLTKKSEWKHNTLYLRSKCGKDDTGELYLFGGFVGKRKELLSLAVHNAEYKKTFIRVEAYSKWANRYIEAEAHHVNKFLCKVWTPRNKQSSIKEPLTNIVEQEEFNTCLAVLKKSTATMKRV